MKIFDFIRKLIDKVGAKIKNHSKDDKSSHKYNYQLLEDKPLTNEESDKFGYSNIAKNIENFVTQSSFSFTVGLYGSWGTGKTTICKFLEEKIREKGEWKVFYFDAWKYEKDSFRRQFLIELDEHLLNGSLRFIEKLNQSRTFNRFKRRKIIMFAVLFIIIGAPFVFLFDRPFHQKILESIIIVLASAGIFKILYDFWINQNLEKVTVDPPDSADRFEHFYKDFLKHKKIRDKKILFVIDNLDRLSGNDSIKILSDIKTFLVPELVSEKENKKIKIAKSIFLIPCDDMAISTFLRKKYGEYFDTEEFLRKFFNVSFRIPKLIELDLDEYTLGKLKEIGIQEFKNNSLVDVIIRAFRNNPREIIQFINSLAVAYQLAKKRKINEVIKNSPFLAKVIAIRQKSSSIYSKLEDRVLRTTMSLEEAMKDLESEEEENKNKNKEKDKENKEFRIVKEFLKFTRFVTADNEDVFFALFQSEEQKKIPEWTSFQFAIQGLSREGSQDGLLSVFKKIKNQGGKKELDNLLFDYVRKEQCRLVKSVKKGKDEFISQERLMETFIAESEILKNDKDISFSRSLDFILEHLNSDVIFKATTSDMGNLEFSELPIKRILEQVEEKNRKRFFNILVDTLSNSVGDQEGTLGTENDIDLLELLNNWPYKESEYVKKKNDELIKAINSIINSINHESEYKLYQDRSRDNEKQRERKFTKTLDFIVNSGLSFRESSKISFSKIARILNIADRQNQNEENFLGDVFIDYENNNKPLSSKKIVELLKRNKEHFANLLEDRGNGDLVDDINGFSRVIYNTYSKYKEDVKIDLFKLVFILLGFYRNISLSKEKNYQVDQEGNLIEIAKHFLKNASISQIKKVINKGALRGLLEWKDDLKNIVIERSEDRVDLLIEFNLDDLLTNDEVKNIINTLISKKNDEELQKLSYYIKNRFPSFEIKIKREIFERIANEINRRREINDDLRDSLKNLNIQEFPDLKEKIEEATKPDENNE